MKYKFLLPSLMLLFAMTTSVLQLQQQASARILKNRTKLMVIVEPELPPLGSASLYLPIEDTVNSSLISKLRNARLLARLNEHRINFYQADLQSSYATVSGKARQVGIKGNFKSINMQRYPNWQYPLLGRIVPLSIEKSLGTIWMIWKEGFATSDQTWQTELGGHDIFALYDQVKIGTPEIVKP